MGFAELKAEVAEAAMHPFRWCAGFFDPTKPDRSMKRLTMLMASATLCRCVAMLSKAIAHQVYQGRPVDQGAVYALGSLAVPVAALAGVAYIFGKGGSQGTPPTGGTDMQEKDATATPDPKEQP